LFAINKPLLKENIMTKLNITLAGAAVAMLAVPLFAGSASADVTSQLGNCKYNSREKTMNCCNQIIRNADRLPMWWPIEERSCGNAGVVKCVGGKKTSPSALYIPPKKCFIVISIDDSNDGGNDETPQRPQRPSRRSFN
jgi:hypothetical protein